MNIAMIIAGGVGSRTNQDIPKQFININDKPVIVYTLEAFQKHPEIDVILVVCLDGWQKILQAYAGRYEIDKLKWIITGGETGMLSIRKGVEELKKFCSDDDIILIHDGIRPNVSQEIISDCIATCSRKGSAIAVVPCAEAILQRDGDEVGSSKSLMDRDYLARAQTPQAFYFEKLVWAHEEAIKRGISNSVATCTLMIELGETVHFSSGSEKNVKITTTDDIDIFEALLSAKKKEWLK